MTNKSEPINGMAFDRMPWLSTGHRATIGRFEYFVWNDNLYRAPKDNDLDMQGYRAGGRWQCPGYMVDSWLGMMREAEAALE